MATMTIWRMPALIDGHTYCDHVICHARVTKMVRFLNITTASVTLSHRHAVLT